MALESVGEAVRPAPAQIRPRGLAVRLFLVAGEHSGDILGGKLLRALRGALGVQLEIAGVGGERMEAEGLLSIFPLSDVAVMGPVAIAKRLPRLIARVNQTVAAAVEFRPDAVVIIDSPEFTHPIAKRIRSRLPGVPIIDYVSPTVWAWRPGRARKMAVYVDHLLALLPFEPEVHRTLGGPRCTYVGHPLVERAEWIRSQDSDGLAERLGLDRSRPIIVVLPGSRPNEVQSLSSAFGAALGKLALRHEALQVLIPVVPAVRSLVADQIGRWPVKPVLVEGEEDKFAAFRLATAALAASGTVTLELAVAGAPMIVAYRVDRIAYHVLKVLIKAPSIVLANLILGRSVFPEFIQGDVNPDLLADALDRLITDSPERKVQLEALGAIDELMAPPASSPSVAAAEIVLQHALVGRG